MSDTSLISDKISIYLEDQSIDSTKSMRYLICLNFIKTVIEDFNGPLPLNTVAIFNQLGHIACCVDTYIDDLSIEVKKDLAESFPAFFDSLKRVESEQEFENKCLNYRSDRLFLAEQACSYNSLYNFYIDCKDLGLLEDLKSFSMDIINSSVAKQNAIHPKELLVSVEKEGRSAVAFLVKFLRSHSILNDTNSMQLSKYLKGLERVLNLADELVDSKRDKRDGVIQLDLDFTYYFILGTAFLKAFLKSFISRPLLFSKHCLQFSYKVLRLELK